MPDKRKNLNGVFDYSTPGVEIREPPKGLVNLRTELALPENSDIAKRALLEPSVEGAIGTIAEMLGVLVDGTFDMDWICNDLAKRMRDRHKSLISTKTDIIIP